MRNDKCGLTVKLQYSAFCILHSAFFRILHSALFLFLTTTFALSQDDMSLWGLEDDSSSPAESAARNDAPNWNGTTGIMWEELPLRDTLDAFAKRNDIGFLLDRRVDPGLPLTLNLQGVTVRDVFEQAAKRHGLGFCELETVAYLGPGDAAELVRLLAVLRCEQLAKLPKTKRDAMLTPRPFRAESLDTPVETLRRLASETGFDGSAFDRLPHDVWPEIDFPNESPCTIFSLLLIGFDRTFAVSKDATKLAPIPIPRELVVSREYKGPIARQLTESELLDLAPDANVAPIPQGVGVEAPLGQLAKIEMRIAKRKAELDSEAAKQRRTAKGPDQSDATENTLARLQNERFTTQPFSGSLDKTLKTLADRLQLKLVIDEKSFAAKNVRPDTRISTEFNQATGIEVFEKCLAPVGAKFRIEDNTITVYME